MKDTIPRLIFGNTAINVFIDLQFLDGEKGGGGGGGATRKTIFDTK